MGFFSNMYTKEGPGVPKDIKQKKGIARFFEIVMRDFGMLWRAGFLTALCFIPAIFALIFTALSFPYILLMGISIIIFLIASMLIGPAMVALHSVVITTVRDIPCYMMHEYKKAWKNNYKQSIPAGMLVSVLYGIQIYSAYAIITQGGNDIIILLSIVLLSLIIITMLSHALFLQIIFIDLPLAKMIKNSLLIAFGFLTRTLPATIIILVVCGAMGLFYIFWPFYILLGIIPVLALIADMWVWPVMDKVFNITQQQEEKRKAQEEQEKSLLLKNSENSEK